MPAHSPAAERNRVPILAELQRLLPARGTALEIAAGTGQHAEHFAAALPDFFLRMHAPALASTLAAWIVTLASIVHFSSRGGGLALHTWLIIIVLSITAPVTTIVLARAALFRRRQAGDDLPPPLSGGSRAP